MEKFITVILVYIFEMLISLCFFSSICEKKIKSNALIILIGGLLFIPSSFIFSLFNNEVINLFVFLVINIVFAIICYKIDIKQSMIYSLLLDVSMFLTELITIFSLSYILNLSVNTYKNDLNVFIIIAIICKLLYFASAQFLSLIINKNGSKKTNSKHFLPLFAFPALTIVNCILFLFIGLKTEMDNSIKMGVAVLCFLYFIFCIFIFLYYQRLLKNEAIINELLGEKRYFKLNNTYMDLLQTQNDELQMLFHDTKHHYSALNAFDNIEDVKNYIAKISPQLESKNNLTISNNKILNLILNKYIVICEKQHIKFNYEVKTSNLEYIEDTELSIILNNIFDNAVEAAQKSQEKQIDFSLRSINNMDLLSVINSCDELPTYKNHQLVTAKDDSINHGFGARIIKRHAQKNNGKYEWSYDKKEQKFHLTIVFQK